ncbi:MAG: hypothetical protein ACRC7N_01485 [Clostridium sp.]
MLKIRKFWNFLKSYVFINSTEALEQIGVLLILYDKGITRDSNYYHVRERFEDEIIRINKNLIFKNLSREEWVDIYYNIPTPRILEEILIMLEELLMEYRTIEIYRNLLRVYNLEKEKKRLEPLVLMKYFERNKKVLECFPKTGGHISIFNSSGLREREQNKEILVKDKFERNILILKNVLLNISQRIYILNRDFDIRERYEQINLNEDFFDYVDLKINLFERLYHENLDENGVIIAVCSIENIEKFYEIMFLQICKEIIYDVDRELVQFVFSKYQFGDIQYIKRIKNSNIRKESVSSVEKIFEDIKKGTEYLDYYLIEYNKILNEVKKLKKLEKKESYRVKQELEEIKNRIILEIKQSMY